MHAETIGTRRVDGTVTVGANVGVEFVNVKRTADAVGCGGPQVLAHTLEFTDFGPTVLEPDSYRFLCHVGFFAYFFSELG